MQNLISVKVLKVLLKQFKYNLRSFIIDNVKNSLYVVKLTWITNTFINKKLYTILLNNLFWCQPKLFNGEKIVETIPVKLIKQNIKFYAKINHL